MTCLGKRLGYIKQGETPVKVNGDTFRGSNSRIFHFVSHLIKSHKLLLLEQMVSFKSRAYFERATLLRKESMKCFSFVKMIENK